MREGWVPVRRKRHFQIVSPSGSVQTVPGSPSDWRTFLNFIKGIEREVANGEEGGDSETRQVGCRSLDDEAAAAEVIERDGRYIQGRFGCKEHPAGKVLRDSRIVFLRALRELGLDVEGVVETRPAPLYGGKNAAKKR